MKEYKQCEILKVQATKNLRECKKNVRGYKKCDWGYEEF